uniref:Uncharacterized protein n=1 Tax=Triticum urartu TaxID=4572 RepID=A0A8R7RDD8_TRIUA
RAPEAQNLDILEVPLHNKSNPPSSSRTHIPNKNPHLAAATAQPIRSPLPIPPPVLNPEALVDSVVPPQQPQPEVPRGYPLTWWVPPPAGSLASLTLPTPAIPPASSIPWY